MYPPVDPVIIQIGPLALRWYGVLIMAGVALAAWIGAFHLERRGLDRDSVWDLLFWVLIPGLIGARLYYVFIQSPRGPDGLDRYLADPAKILAIWEGGLHIFGGFLGGALGVIAFARLRKAPLLVYGDAIALGLPLGQAVGRWANFINQELYGPPTTLPWGLRIDPEYRIGPYRDLVTYPETTRFHPLFLYESLWNAVGFAIIFSIWKRYGDRLRDGDVLLMYLIWYPLGRFFIEFLRTDSWFFPGTAFNTVHVLSLIAIVSALALFFQRYGHRLRRQTLTQE
ncbi:prolipoprotein diacylglyceryl transferase [Chloroflexus sp.]|uniref:prolipoprotein diacylglyceryl transferase n=2 Tax=Chloroflexus sp. TaxID=1904827 RepID=UPI00298F1683|nr:prolipoprotein diacylglyceryl transferase [Chloroflexus sp.]MCS6888061.1 prolipoprotein diacylglyceryl transferase [Chloroflexus sp.]MDW8402770.1 prolipoprotein diacylglyceryl transferase [Chloroflexus sp.]